MPLQNDAMPMDDLPEEHKADPPPETNIGLKLVKLEYMGAEETFARTRSRLLTWQNPLC
jgi:hypothetical protein